MSLAAIAFVVYAAIANRDTIIGFDYAQLNLWAFLGSSVFYVTCSLAAMANWAQILRGLSSDIRGAPSTSVFLVAQLGRYLPGNVGHYFGRMVLGRAVGISVKISGLGSVVEILAALAAGGLIFLGVYLFAPSTFAQALAFLPPQATPFRVLVVILGLLALVGLATKQLQARTQFPMIGVGTWVRATVLATTSLLLTGMSFGLFMHSIMPLNADQFGLALVVFSMAWLAGFVTPGAPAGLGIREAVILAFLAPVFGGGAALSVSVLHRLLCTLIDVLLSAAGWGIYVRVRSQYEKND